jgi:hypothetical protein
MGGIVRPKGFAVFLFDHERNLAGWSMGTLSIALIGGALEEVSTIRPAGSQPA